MKKKLFDLSGDFSPVDIVIDVREGYLLGNNASYANSTKKGVVITYTTGTPNTLKIYDMYEETIDSRNEQYGTLGEWVNTDTIYLFDSSGIPILGAT